MTRANDHLLHTRGQEGRWEMASTALSRIGCLQPDRRGAQPGCSELKRRTLTKVTAVSARRMVHHPQDRQNGCPHRQAVACPRPVHPLRQYRKVDQVSSHIHSTPSSSCSRTRNVIIRCSRSLGTGLPYGTWTVPLPVAKPVRSASNASQVLGVNAMFACFAWPLTMNRIVPEGCSHAREPHLIASLASGAASWASARSCSSSSRPCPVRPTRYSSIDCGRPTATVWHHPTLRPPASRHSGRSSGGLASSSSRVGGQDVADAGRSQPAEMGLGTRGLLRQRGPGAGRN